MTTLTTQKNVEKLHARLVDSLNGYRTAMDRTDDAALLQFLADFGSLREKHVEELGKAIEQNGFDPQSDGSWRPALTG